MAKKKGNPNQSELDNLPERSVLGKKALEYLRARDRVEAEQKNLEARKQELLELFIEGGQNSIIVDGRKVFYAHSESNQVKVKKAE